MNVADQLRKAGIFLTDNEFISVLKKMAMSTMPSVVENGITGKYAAHIGGQPAWPAPQKDMCVLVHEDPGVNGGLCLKGDIPHPGYKIFSVLIIIYDFFQLDAPYYDMVQSTRRIQSGSPRHGYLTLLTLFFPS